VSDTDNFETSIDGEQLAPDWTMATIGDLVKVRNGYAFKSADYKDEGVLLIRQSNLGGEKVSLKKAKYLPESFLEDHPDFSVKKGDILIGMSGSIGKICTYDLEEPALQNQRTGLLVFKDERQRRWFWHYLPLLERDLVKVGKGVAVQNISAKQIESFPIPIAPPGQQKRIVAEIEKQFSRLDEAVANLKRVKANLKRYKAAVLKAAVEGKLTEEWRKQHPDVEPADKLLERILAERREKWQGRGKYKEPVAPNTTNLAELPEGWVWVTLPQLGEINRGKSKHRPRNDSKLFGGDYPFVQTGDVRHAVGEIKSYKQTYSEAGLAQSRLWPKGTLCITIAANIADTALLGFDACFPDSVVGFLPETEHTNIRFVEYFIRTAKENLERFAPATAQKNINLQILKAVAVPFPPEREQNTIVFEIESRLSVVEKIESTLNLEVARSDRLRQSILKKAFSGKLVSNQ